MNFGLILKNLRKKKGISIKKLAPELDITYTYLSKLENDKVYPSEEVIKRIGEYFDYDTDELLISANKIPKDIIEILQSNPKEAIRFLRENFRNLRDE